MKAKNNNNMAENEGKKANDTCQVKPYNRYNGEFISTSMMSNFSLPSLDDVYILISSLAPHKMPHF